MKCTACGENNVDNAKFCAFCGAKFDEKRHMPNLQVPGEVPEGAQPAPSARPLADNPMQPARRAMPHLGAENASGEAAPAAPQEAAAKTAAKPVHATATPHFTPVPAKSSAPTPAPAPKAKPRQVFLFDDEIEEEEEKKKDEAERKRKEAFKKAHSKPDDELFYDEDDLEYGEDFEDEDPKGGRIFIKIVSVLTVLALLCAIGGVLYATPLGGRLRAQWGISSDYEDYLSLARYQLSRGNKEGADTSFLNTLKLKSDDFDVAMEIGQGFEVCGDTQRAEQLFLMLIERYPTEGAPYDHLMAILYAQGRMDQYQALIELRTKNQPAYVQPGTYPAPTANVESGVYIQPVTLVLTAEAADEIRFTLNGETATAESTLYTRPLVISSGSVSIRAVAVYGDHVSEEWVGQFTIQ